MVRHKLLLAVLATGLAFLPTTTKPNAAINVWAETGCSVDGSRTGTCSEPETSAGLGDGGVDVSAGWDGADPGSGAGGGAGSGGDVGDGGGTWDGNGGLPDGVSVVPGGVAVDDGDAASGPFLPPRRGVIVDPAAPADPACVPQTPCDPALVVRVSDLVSIQADAPSQGMEPDGWLVVGIPTNFFASASTHVHSGSLLGAPADVRFTPVGFRWDYGDGTSATATSGGSSWAALNLPEFSETSTSHVFEQTGTLTIRLDVSYSAEYSFAGSEWRPVQGLLEVPASPITAIADRAGTVLVAESCSTDPGGPGC